MVPMTLFHIYGTEEPTLNMAGRQRQRQHQQHHTKIKKLDPSLYSSLLKVLAPSLKVLY